MQIPVQPISWKYDAANNVLIVQFRNLPVEWDNDPITHAPDQEYTLEIPVTLKWAVYTGTHTSTTEGAVEP